MSRFQGPATIRYPYARGEGLTSAYNHLSDNSGVPDAGNSLPNPYRSNQPTGPTGPISASTPILAPITPQSRAIWANAQRATALADYAEHPPEIGTPTATGNRDIPGSTRMVPGGTITWKGPELQHPEDLSGHLETDAAGHEPNPEQHVFHTNSHAIPPIDPIVARAREIYIQQHRDEANFLTGGYYANQTAKEGAERRADEFNSAYSDALRKQAGDAHDASVAKTGLANSTADLNRAKAVVTTQPVAKPEAASVVDLHKSQGELNRAKATAATQPTSRPSAGTGASPRIQTPESAAELQARTRMHDASAARSRAAALESLGTMASHPNPDVRSKANELMKLLQAEGAATTSSTSAPVTTGKVVTPEIKDQLLAETGGDKEKARALARQRGYQF